MCFTGLKTELVTILNVKYLCLNPAIIRKIKNIVFNLWNLGYLTT